MGRSDLSRSARSWTAWLAPPAGLGEALAASPPATSDPSRSDSSPLETYVLLGDDLLAWITLAFGAALAVGTGLALVRPPADPGDTDLVRPPLARSVVMIILGSIAAIWGLASLLT